MQLRKDRRAFTIVELLIALAITAMLLTATAIAFNASIKNYQENEAMFKAMNNARQAMVRMTSQLRTAGGMVGGTLRTVFPLSPSNTNVCNFYTPAGDYITYEFRDASYANQACRNKLYLIKDGVEYVLCDNVTSMTFTKTPYVDGTCKSVQISMTVGIGDVSQTVSSAAVIRKGL